MNKGINILADWFSANKLSLNVYKSKYMLFCRSLSPQYEEFPITMSNMVI